jgi:hypothetical protein
VSGGFLNSLSVDGFSTLARLLQLLVSLLEACLRIAPAGGAAEPERFLVVTNWFTELRERMGGN